jgi:hypothetical protein
MNLNAENMWMITMSPVNRQWISDQAALAKNSPSVAAVTGLDEAWLQHQSELADNGRQKLLDAIDMLLKSQSGSTCRDGCRQIALRDGRRPVLEIGADTTSSIGNYLAIGPCSSVTARGQAVTAGSARNGRRSRRRRPNR